MLRFACVLTIVLLAAASGSRAETPITACGQTLGLKENGILQADIVCQAPTQTGVSVLGGKLELNGHVLSGGTVGVACVHGCTIEGPGEIAGFSQYGVTSTNDRRIRVTLRNVDIHDNSNFGVLLPWDARLKMSGVTVRNNNRGGVGLGPTNSLGNVTGKDVTITANHGPGVEAKTIRLSSSTVEGNDGTGVYSVNGTAVLSASTITGNGTNSSPSYDIKTLKRPRLLKGSSCGLSGSLTGTVVTGTWSVCSGD